MAKISVSQVLDVVALSALQRSGQVSEPQVLQSLAAFRSLNDRQGAHLFQLLAEHRLQCLFWDGLKRAGATDCVPASMAEALKATLSNELMRRAAFDLGFLRATRALEMAGLPPVACKGIVLAQHYYPTRGLRRMHDLDFWLLEPAVERCTSALQEAGFDLRREKTTDHSLNFINADGVVLDVHLEMNLFQSRGFSLEELSIAPHSSQYRVFVPEAMLTHLLAHLLGHAAYQGILLCWFIDIALVLRKNSIDPERLRLLMRPDGSWFVFLRVLRTFLQLGWVEDALGLEAELAQVQGIPWERLMRQRRRVGWAGLRGKLRLGRSIYQHSRDHAPYPHLADWLWGPLDWLTEATRIAGPGGFLIPRPE